MTSPRVSVIIPTFNRAHLILETLESIFKQSYTNFECIIIDDGSVDNTVQLVKTYCLKDQRFKFFQRPEDRVQGGNDARNYGFEVSNGNYIQWFDDDDVMQKEFLQTKVDAFEPSTDFVICTGKYLRNGCIDKASIDIKINTFLYKDYVLYHAKIFTPSVMFRRAYLQHKRLFNTNILRGQETELFSRLFFNVERQQYKIINKPLFLYRQHEQTKTHLNETYISEYKTSEIFVAIEHLKRSLSINDPDMTQYFYRLLINFLFRAIENNDKTNVDYLMKTINKLVKPINKRLVFQLNMAIKLLLRINRGFYKIEMYFKTYKFQNV